MAQIIFNFDPVERFVVGTIGEPGERTFYLQARSGTRLTSVAAEKSQIFAIAERITFLLKELKKGDPTFRVETLPIDSDPLEQPVFEEFRVGVMGLSWLSDREMVAIDFQAAAVDEDENADIAPDDSEEALDILRVLLTPAQAQAFALRSQMVLNAGRPPCPFCAAPLDPRGHLCPRANGYRR